MENIYELNDIARRYSELSREDAAKFKAVLEHEVWRGWDKINAILNDLDCYEFDGTINYVSEFGEKYLSEMLPPDFDRSLLKGACTAEFAEKIRLNPQSSGNYKRVWYIDVPIKLFQS